MAAAPTSAGNVLRPVVSAAAPRLPKARFVPTKQVYNVPIPHELCTSLRNGGLARLKQVVVPWSHQNLAITSILLRHGLIANVSLGSPRECDPAAFHAAPVVARRLWCDLKYRDQRPVIGDMQVVSKPGKRVFVSAEELARIVRGSRARFIEPVRLGEIFIVAERGPEVKHLRDVKYWDAREALTRNIGGELICRARPE